MDYVKCWLKEIHMDLILSNSAFLTQDLQQQKNCKHSKFEPVIRKILFLKQRNFGWQILSLWNRLNEF